MSRVILFGPTSRRRRAGREGVVPDGRPRQGQDLTTSQEDPKEGPQTNRRSGVCPFRCLALGRCRNCSFQTRCADLRRDHSRRGRCRSWHHPLRQDVVRSCARRLMSTGSGTSARARQTAAIPINGHLSRCHVPNVVAISRPDVTALIEKAAKKIARKTEAAVALAMRRLLDHDAQAGSLFGAHRGTRRPRSGRPASGRYSNRACLPARYL